MLGEDIRGKNLESYNVAPGADLSGADLTRATFVRGKARGAIFVKATLIETDLRYTDLKAADLERANLSQANLEKARLFRTNLASVRATQANFRSADLREARLMDAQLDGATLSNAKLWGTLRDGWSIKGVICERAYWDREGKIVTEYGPGEFERVFAEKPRIVLKYPDGLRQIDLLMLPLVIERLQAEHPGCKLHVRSIQDEGGGATVTITVDGTANRPPDDFSAEVDEIRTQATTLQTKLLASEEARHRLEGELATFHSQIMPLFREMAMAPKYTITGPAGNVGDDIRARDNFVTTNDLEAIGTLIAQVQDKAAAIEARAGAAQLAELLRQLDQLRAQAAAAKPDRALIAETKKTIRNIAEGSVGSVLGTGWLTALQSLF